MSFVRVAWTDIVLAESACLVGLGQNPQAPRVRRTPEFAGAAIPDPPQQARPWTRPATKMPRSLAKATPLLFEQGMADPRLRPHRPVDLKLDDGRRGMMSAVFTLAGTP